MTWEELHRWIWAQERQHFVPRELRPAFDLSGATSLWLQRQLENDELNYSYEIDAAIDQWLETDEWPALNHLESYYLWLRLDRACSFVALLAGSPKLRAFPIMLATGLEKEVVRWLLTDWWETHGRAETARSFLLEHIEEPPRE